MAGTVQFQADGSDIGPPQAVDGGGNASVSTSTLAVGSRTITADFTSSNPNTLNSGGGLTPDRAGGRHDDRRDLLAQPVRGRSAVSFTATVSAVSPGAGTPSGSVQFSDNGTPFGAPQTLDGSGAASITTAALAVGTHTIAATYTPAPAASTAALAR